LLQITLDDEEQREDLAVIELYNLDYDSVANTLKYDIVTENGTSIDLPNEFGESTLVIDDIADIGHYYKQPDLGVPNALSLAWLP